MAIKKVLPIQAGVRPETKNFLTSEAITAGTAVALGSAGQLVIADRTSKDSSSVVGFAAADSPGGSTTTLSVQIAGNLALAGWSFSQLGQPVYLDTTGSLTQDASGFANTDYLVEVGLAIGANQIMVRPQNARLLQVIEDEMMAVTSKVVFTELAKKADLDPNKARQTGRMVQFAVDGKTLETLDGVLAPAEDGTLLTNNSELICVDYGG